MNNTFTNLHEKASDFVLINLSEDLKDFPLVENKDITIGRHSDNVIRISDEFGFVSRFHAVIRVRKGKCFFEDLTDNKNDSYWTSFDNYKSSSIIWKRFKKGEETHIVRDTIIRLGGEKTSNPDIPNARVCDIKIVIGKAGEYSDPTITNK